MSENHNDIDVTCLRAASAPLCPKEKVIQIISVLPHECIVKEAVPDLALVSEGEITRLKHRRVIVDRHSGLLIDGHHRLQAYKNAGISVIHAILVDYHATALVTHSDMKIRQNINKSVVLRAASSAELLPAKSTSHQLLVPGAGQVHIDVLNNLYAP